MSRTVCVLTAGRGTRLGTYSEHLNKALLPLDGKAVISHIIEKFPEGTEFVVALGFFGEQVRQYLGIAHPDVRFHFVEIDNYDGPGSGPGYSLLCCRSHLQQPFYFVSSDTLWDNALEWDESHTWLGVAPVEAARTERYCTLRVSDDRITELRDKMRVDDPAFEAFVGLCFIKEHDLFWNGLESRKRVAGEHQVSNGLRALIDRAQVAAQHIEWLDVGDVENYQRAVLRYEDYDFSKQNEALYILNGKVIKFFADARVAQRRVQKARLRPDVFPEIADARGQFYAYRFQPGSTLYQVNSARIFTHLLAWLEAKLWSQPPVDPTVMSAACMAFYRDKTRERLALYERKYPLPDPDVTVNGATLPMVASMLERVDWNWLADGLPSFMHGDLQFDNILYDPDAHEFRLLDWRQDFGGHVDFGDRYYDLAKLYGGIVLNYDYIKLNLLSYTEREGDIVFDFPQRFLSQTYLRLLEKHIQAHGYDLDKVKLLVALIYINMAPLHHYPFDKMLYSLGRTMLAAHVGVDG